MTTTTSLESQKTESLDGTGGWLTLFMVKVGGLSAISYLVNGLAPFGPHGTGLSPILIIEVPLAVFAMVVFFSLGYRKKIAPKLSVIYLWTELIIVALASFGISPSFSSVIGFILALAWFVIWLRYFKVSRRVKATFGYNC